MTNSIFDAFFWIEPTKSDPKSAYNGTKVIWHYPDDVSAITNEFRDIPQFCYPDLVKMKLEKAQECKSEHFTFTLTGSDGKRVYGVCMRSLFRGVKRRHDVQRRPKHCLCFITRYPFFSTFRSMLLEVHAIALLEQHPGSCKMFLDVIYRQGLFPSDAKLGGYVKCITASQSLIPDLRRDFNLIPPRFGRISSRETPILPLFEILGIDRFFKLLSAIMTERRIIFLADEVETLSSSVLAAASMIHPFSWHHIFIPLLPAKLLSYAAAPMPYLIGVRRYLLPELYREPLDGVLIVDLNSGDISMYGGEVVIRDLVGDSGNALKQATEQMDRMVAGMANIFKKGTGQKSSNDGDSGNNRDLMVMILSDLKAVCAAKPGAASITSVASGLLRGLPGQIRSTEEAKAQWTLESEKTLRDSLTHFFVYLFGDLEDFIRTVPLPATPTGKPGAAGPGSKGGKNSGDPFSQGDSRSMYDLKAFQHRHNQMGDSKLLQDFVNEFMHSQMFERFCDERIQKQKMQRESRSSSTASSASGGAVGSGNEEQEDLFEVVCSEIRTRQMQLSVTNAKQLVHSRSAMLNESGGVKMVGTNFHQLTMQYTSSSQSANTDSGPSDASEMSMMDIEMNTSNAGGDSNAGGGGGNKYSPSSSVLERICAESHWSDAFMKIMNTINFRLETCVVAKCRGSAGTSGVRAMSLLRSLLINGPDCTLSYALDFIPIIRKLIRIGAAKKEKSSGGGAGDKITAQALEFISSGASVDPRPHALTLLSLMLDHNKLIVQKTYEAKKRAGNFRYLAANVSNKSRELNSKKLGIFGSKQFPRFADLHAQMNTSGQRSVGPGVVMVTPQELLVRRTEDMEEDEVEGGAGGVATSESAGSSRVTSADRAQKGHSGRLDAPVDPFANPFGDTSTHSSVNSRTTTPVPASAAATSRPSSTGPPVPPKRMSVNISAPPPHAVGTPAAAAAHHQRPAAVEVNLLDMDEPEVAGVTPSSTSTTDAFAPSTATAVAASTSQSTTPTIESSKYRVFNQDTGEVLDIREIARLQKQQLQLQQQQQQQTVKSTGRLSPPPPSAAPLKAAKPKPKSTDPFGGGFTDAWGSEVKAQQGGTDAFGFSTTTTAAAPTSHTSTSGGVWSTNNQAAIDAFAPSTSWATTAAPSSSGTGLTVTRPVAGAYPTSAVISSGAMNGYGGAPARPPRDPFAAMGAANTNNPVMYNGNNGYNQAPPQPPQFNSFTPSVPPMQQQQHQQYQQPPPMPQFAVRQVGQGPPIGQSKAPPKDPFSDLVNLK